INADVPRASRNLSAANRGATMTAERRFVIELGDIVAVTLECKTCKTRLTRPPKEVNARDLHACPGCHHPWWEPPIEKLGPPRSPFADFLGALSSIGDVADQVGFRLLLEVEEPRS